MKGPIEKALDKFIKNRFDLTDDLNLSFNNIHGETITMKVDDKGNAFYNHSDIHENEDDFYPIEAKAFVVLEANERAIMNLYETMVFVFKQNKK